MKKPRPNPTADTEIIAFVNAELERSWSSAGVKPAPVKMPAFEKHVAPGDVEALWRYVAWLRTEGSIVHAEPTKERHHD